MNSNSLNGNRKDKVNSQMANAVRKQDGKQVQSLIDQRADIHANLIVHETFPWRNGAIEIKLSIIFLAIKEGAQNILDILIQSGANIQEIHEKVGSTLHYAVKHGKHEIVKNLVEKGVDVNIKDSQNQTPLLFAVQNGDESLVKLLLDLGAKINGPGYNEAIFAAIELKSSEILKILVKNGAEVNFKDEINESTPLHIAVSDHKYEMANILVEAGANVNARNEESVTPLAQIFDEDVWKLKNSSEITKRLETDMKIAKLLIDNNAEIDAKNIFDETPLHEACRYNYVEIAKLLLQKGANVSSRNDRGESPLLKTILWGHAKIVELLLQNGAEIDATDKDNRTPLNLAVCFKKQEVVKILVDHGADLTIKDHKTYLTPLEIAKNRNLVECAEILMEKMIEMKESVKPAAKRINRMCSHQTNIK